MCLLRFARLNVMQQSAPAANVTVFELDHPHITVHKHVLRRRGFVGSWAHVQAQILRNEEGSGCDTDPSPSERRLTVHEEVPLG
jgi:hypothetical protein